MEKRETVPVPRAIEYAYRISRLSCMSDEVVPLCVSELAEVAEYVRLVATNAKGEGPSRELVEHNIRNGFGRFAGHRFKVL